MAAARVDDAEVAVEAADDGTPGTVLIIACGALAREILAVVRANGLDHVTLKCLPAQLHNRPEKIADAVEALIEAEREHYDEILIGYGDCGTGGRLDAMLERHGVRRIAGAHCYAFFTGVEAFMARAEDEIAAFYLTDFMVRQFDAFITRPLGLDRHPELRDMYFGNYEKLVYLVQQSDSCLDRKADLIAQRLGLPLERRPTGFGDLAGFVEGDASTMA